MSYLFPDGTVPVLLSSGDLVGLRGEAAALRRYVDDHPHATPQQICDILSSTRTPRSARALIRVPSNDLGHTASYAALSSALSALERGERSTAPGTPGAAITVGDARPRRVAMVFPGQGSQSAGMGRTLYRESASYRDAVDHCNALAHKEHGIRPVDYLVDPHAPETLEVIQPASFVHMMGLHQMWADHGVLADMTVGHSQGEIAAACVAGAISLDDGLRTVIVRSRESQRIIDQNNLAGTYAMAVVGADRDTVERLIPQVNGWVDVSVVNSPQLHAVSGEMQAVAQLESLLRDRGTFVRRIAVDFAAHTHVVDMARTALLADLSAANPAPFAEGHMPFISGVLGDQVSAGQSQPSYWFANLRQRVRFDLAMRSAVDRGATSFIEVSGHPSLLVAMKENIGDAGDIRVCGTTRRDAEALEVFAENLAKVLVTHRGVTLPRPEESVRVPFSFPSTVWRRDKFWSATDTVSASPGLRGARPATLRDSWEPLGVQDLPAPRRLLVFAEDAGDTGLGTALLVDELNHQAMRYGSEVVSSASCIEGMETSEVVAIIAADADGHDSTEEALSELYGRLSGTDLAGVAEVLVVTRGSEDRDTASAATRPAALAAMARCLAPELAPVRLRHVDIDPTMSAAEATRKIVDAAHIPAEPDLAIIDGDLRARRLLPVPSAQRSSELSAGFDAEAIASQYSEALVLGGTGEVGREICRRLAELGVPRIVCVSRSGARGLVAADFDAIRNATGAEVVDVRCDLSDEAAIGALGQSLSGSHGQISDESDEAEERLDRRIVVHCLVDYSAAANLNWNASLAVKSRTIPAVTTELMHRGDLLLVCSSMSASIGARGHAAYAAANRALETEALAAGTTAGEQVVAVRWGLWPGVGSGAGVGGSTGDSMHDITSTGFHVMDPAAAVDQALIAGTGVVTIAAVDWARTSAVFGTLGMAPLFDLATDFSEHREVQDSPRVDNPRANIPEDAAAVYETRGGTTTESSGANPADEVERVVREKLGYAPDVPFDTTMPLVSLGIDSLQALDVETELADITHGAVTAVGILGGATLDELSLAVRKEQS